MPGRMSLAAVLASFVLAGPAAAPYSDAQRSYPTILAAYRHQDIGGLDRIAEMSGDEIAGAVRNLLEAAPTPGSESIDTLRAAAMLHTDVALWLAKQQEVTNAHHHVLAAARLVDEADTRTGGRSDFGRRWYAIASRHFHAAGLAAWSAELQTRARQRSTPSPTEAWARGAFDQGLRFEMRAATAGPLTRFGDKGRFHGVDVIALQWLDSAAGKYQEALKAHRSLTEAALHLGRVRFLQGRFREAGAPLEQAMAAAEPRTRYLARLFLGALAERQDRFAEAESHYRAALASYRWGQSGALALAQVLDRTGRQADARAIMARHLADSRGLVVEPLWTYLLTPAEDDGRMLHELRAEIWQ